MVNKTTATWRRKRKVAFVLAFVCVNISCAGLHGVLGKRGATLKIEYTGDFSKYSCSRLEGEQLATCTTLSFENISMTIGELQTRINNLYEASLHRQKDGSSLGAEMESTILSLAKEESWKSPAVRMMYVGGHKSAITLQNYLKSGNIVRAHVFEPIAQYVESLRAAFRNSQVVEVHPFGLGATSYSKNVAVQAARTTVFENCGLNQSACDMAHVRSVQKVLTEFGIKTNAKEEFFLYANCEGCEIELMESLLLNCDLKCMQKFIFFKLATHNEAISEYIPRWATIRVALAKTHALERGFPFAQELWVRKKHPPQYIFR